MTWDDFLTYDEVTFFIDKSYDWNLNQQTENVFVFLFLSFFIRFCEVESRRTKNKAMPVTI